MESKSNIQRSQIAITPLSQRIVENLDILPDILKHLELGILAVFERYRTPLTTKEVRTFFISMKSDWLIGKLETKNFKEGFLSFEKKTATKKDLEKYNKELIRFVNKRKPTKPQLASFMEKQQKKLGIDTPSYKKFNKSLETLQSLGLVAKRIDPTDKRRKQLWLLSPAYLIAKKENKKK